MKSSFCLRMFLAFVLLLSTAATAKTSTCSTVSSNVTTIVHDYDTSGVQLLLRSDDYNGTAQAAYGAADPNLSSSIYCGQWFLRMYSQSVRTLWITPNDAVNSSQPVGPPAGYYWQDVEAAAGCSDQNGNTVPLQNIVTTSSNCGMIVDFYSGGTKYKLSMGPFCSTCTPGPTGTGLVTITCNSVSNGQCVNWTFTPNMTPSTANPPTVANLYYYGKGGKLVFVGQYYDTFRIDVTNP